MTADSSAVSCVCGDGTIFSNATDCNDCQKQCNDDGHGGFTCASVNPKTFMGISVAIVLVLLWISIALFIGMIVFSVIVLRRCGDKPSWLKPTVISLLVLWILFSWFPGLNIIFFVVLLVILIVFINKCSKGRK